MRNDGQINVPEILVLMIQMLKEDPFKSLIRLCNPITHSVLNGYFFSSYEKEDCLQEAHKILLLAVDGYRIDQGMPFLQFYHKLLINHMNMLVRKEKAHKRRVNMETMSLDNLVEEGGIHVQGTSSSTTYPEEVTIANETLDRYLVNLSPFELEVFLLFMDGKTPEEIADNLKTKREKVRNALYRCVRKFKNVIKY